MPMIALDTHILLHALAGSLQAEEREQLEATRWGVSSIVLWEIAKLVQLGRVELELDDPTLAAALAQIEIWPIDLSIARMSTRLDFRGDPADEIIAATSVVLGIPLLTRDRVILESKMVPLA